MMGFNVFLSFHLHGRAKNYLLSSAPAHSRGNRGPGLHKLATAWLPSPTMTEGFCDRGFTWFLSLPLTQLPGLPSSAWGQPPTPCPPLTWPSLGDPITSASVLYRRTRRTLWKHWI